MLGIGAGEDMNLQPYGLDHPKVDRLREAIECIRLLWTSSSEKGVSYDGKYFRLKNAFLTIRPVQKPYPPIYVGALGPRTREIAGELADGWLPWIVYPAGFKEDMEDIERGACRAGRSLRQFDAVASVCVAVSKDVDEARKAVEQECREALVLERRTMNRLGFEIDLPSDVRIQKYVYSKKAVQTLEEATKRVPADAVDAISVYGTVDDCIGKIEEFVEAGATHVVITNMGPDLEKTLKSFKEFIIPHFRKDHCL
jgi:alkanesulfonate monooxygenase SsuD/methylene tetrahydromethanopterin reductase-like flavin-dependent oxidoreductase (luciferase family)